jgi:hypothetical protein
VFVEGRAVKDVAKQFGLAERSVRQLVYEFRQHCRHGTTSSPFFASGEPVGLPGRRPAVKLRRKKSPPSPIASN